MTEPLQDLVRKAPCGCMHDPQGKPLVVCVTHCTDVEGQRGMRVRLSDGSLTFFAMSPSMADAPQPPPEESLCGEEEALAAGMSAEPTEAVKTVSGGEVPEQLRMWRLHVRGVARSRQKAYAEALSLAQMQFVAWRDAFPVAFDAAMDAQAQPRINAREAQMLDFFGAGYAEFLREVWQIARDGG